MGCTSSKLPSLGDQPVNNNSSSVLPRVNQGSTRDSACQTVPISSLEEMEKLLKNLKNKRDNRGSQIKINPPSPQIRRMQLQGALSGRRVGDNSSIASKIENEKSLSGHQLGSLSIKKDGSMQTKIMTSSFKPKSLFEQIEGKDSIKDSQSISKGRQSPNLIALKGKKIRLGSFNIMKFGEDQKLKVPNSTRASKMIESNGSVQLKQNDLLVNSYLIKTISPERLLTEEKKSIKYSSRPHESLSKRSKRGSIWVGPSLEDQKITSRLPYLPLQLNQFTNLQPMKLSKKRQNHQKKTLLLEDDIFHLRRQRANSCHIDVNENAEIHSEEEKDIIQTLEQMNTSTYAFKNLN